MDIRRELEFLTTLDQQVAAAAEAIAVIPTLFEVISMLKSRIQTLQHLLDEHSGNFSSQSELDFLLLLEDKVLLLTGKVSVNNSLKAIIFVLMTHIKELQQAV
jgi:hypothetical protein